METDDTKRKVIRALGSSTVATWFWMCGCWTKQIQTVHITEQRGIAASKFGPCMLPRVLWTMYRMSPDTKSAVPAFSAISAVSQAFDKFAAKEAVERVPLYHGCSARFLEARVKHRGGRQCWAERLGKAESRVPSDRPWHQSCTLSWWKPEMTLWWRVRLVPRIQIWGDGYGLKVSNSGGHRVSL